MLLNPFSLFSETFTAGSRIDALYCICTDIIVMFETHGIGQTSRLLEHYLVLWKIVSSGQIIGKHRQCTDAKRPHFFAA